MPATVGGAVAEWWMLMVAVAQSREWVPLSTAKTRAMRAGLFHLAMTDSAFLMENDVFEDLRLCLDEIDRLRSVRA